MREYLIHSDFYSKIFSTDPDFGNAELLNLTIENNHAYVAFGFSGVLPDNAPKNWNKNGFNSTKIIISFFFIKNVTISNILQNEMWGVDVNQKPDSSIDAVFRGNAGSMELSCEFMTIRGIIPYDDTWKDSTRQ